MQAFNYIMMRDYVPYGSSIDKFVPFDWNYWFQYLSYRVHRKLEGKYRKDKYDLSNVEESIVKNDYIHAGFPFVSMFNWFEQKGIPKPISFINKSHWLNPIKFSSVSV
ncbi:hypothetical protein V8V91_05085 [Algoriphagus halophilus]|uniref:hypothetical protein n=1 Tax=Algoriphagus halophilus TaxID=226505 RepID=UPI00358DE596